MDIRSTTNRLLRDPNVVKWLKIADTHMQAYNKFPEGFVLPEAHALIGPLVSRFASDGAGFVDYIKSIRDASDGGAKEDLHDLYRTISLRYIQQGRRHRLRQAVLHLQPALAKDMGREPTVEELLLASRFIEQRWGAMRLNWMAKERKLRRADRLTSEERALTLEEFWRDIDRQLDAGKAPLGGADHYAALLKHLT